MAEPEREASPAGKLPEGVVVLAVARLSGLRAIQRRRPAHRGCRATSHPSSGFAPGGHRRRRRPCPARQTRCRSRCCRPGSLFRQSLARGDCGLLFASRRLCDAEHRRGFRPGVSWRRWRSQNRLLAPRPAVFRMLWKMARTGSSFRPVIKSSLPLPFSAWSPTKAFALSSAERGAEIVRTKYRFEGFCAELEAILHGCGLE